MKKTARINERKFTVQTGLLRQATKHDEFTIIETPSSERGGGVYFKGNVTQMRIWIRRNGLTQHGNFSNGEIFTKHEILNDVFDFSMEVTKKTKGFDLDKLKRDSDQRIIRAGDTIEFEKKWIGESGITIPKGEKLVCKWVGQFHAAKFWSYGAVRVKFNGHTCIIPASYIKKVPQ